MSRKHANALVVADEFDEEEVNVLKCSECGSTNIYSETVSEKEWKGNREMDKSFTRFTCMNLDCGHTWRG